MDAISGTTMNVALKPLEKPSWLQGASVEATGSDVTSFFTQLVDKVNQLQGNADNMVKKFAAGEGGELHEVMLAVEKAGLSFQYLNQVRNKAMDAYQEIMKMSV